MTCFLNPMRTDADTYHLPSERASQAVLSEQVAERRRKLREAQNTSGKQEQLIDIAQRDIKKLHQKWKAVHARTAEARSFLCREAAMLYGLRLKRRKGGNMDYLIGGVTVPNYLRDLNGLSLSPATTLACVTK
jgi:K+-sensing histidine kinase KdpD